MNCVYCNREINNKGSLVAHQVCCKENPERVPHRRGEGAGRQKGCQAWNEGLSSGNSKYWKEKFPLDAVLIENSTYPRHSVKKRILDENLIPYICKICGIEPFWNGKPMPLILDHINGVNNDNRLKNLRFVCSNCDTQLDTYKSKNKKMVSSA